jgi:hypothetical protein
VKVMGPSCCLAEARSVAALADLGAEDWTKGRPTDHQSLGRRASKPRRTRVLLTRKIMGQ